MQTVRVLEKTGKDGVLHLHIPLGTPEAEFEVVVVLQPRQISLHTSASAERGWPPGFIERTAGAWQGELERPPQGEFEKRVGLEE